MNTILLEDLPITETPTTFKKGEFIPVFQANKKEIALVKSGKVSLMRSDEEGNLVFLEEYKEDDIFSKLWIYNEMNDLFIECNTDCEIYFLDFSLFIQNETNKYTLFLLNKMSSCIRKLNKKSTILQKKSMEDKLLTYFRAIAKKENAKRFEVPLTFKDLADYLGVDRSSLMRKLNDLEAKKKIKRSGKTIFLKS